MYYNIAIITSENPYDYGSTWETFEQLRSAGHAVEVLDTMRFPDALTEGGTPNYQYLSKFIDVFKPDYISYANESADAILEKVQAADCGIDAKPRHFVIFGYVGKDNFGDELLFGLISSRLRDMYPGSYVSLIGDGPERALQRHGVVSIKPNEKAAARAMLNGASALIYMAGLIMDGPFEETAGMIELFGENYLNIAGQASMMLLASMCDVPSVMLGIGAGPLSNPDAQRLLRLAALTRPLVVARDAHTAELLRDAGIPDDLLHVKADVAFSIDPDDYRGRPDRLGDLPADKDYMVVALRDWPSCPDGLFHAMSKALDALCGEYGLIPVFLNFDPADTEVSERVISEMAFGSLAVSLDTASTDQTLQLIAHTRLAVGMRLHCSILACILGTQCVGLDYNDKVAAFFDQMGISDHLIGLDSDSDGILSKCERCLQGGDAAAEDIRQRVEKNRSLADESFELVKQAIDNTAGSFSPQIRYPRSKSIDSCNAEYAAVRVRELGDELSAAYDRLGDVERRLAAAEGRVREMEESTTWKVGRVATVIPRAIKSAIQRRSAD